jgi:SAM-dependent methyltransferase
MRDERHRPVSERALSPGRSDSRRRGRVRVDGSSGCTKTGVRGSGSTGVPDSLLSGQATARGGYFLAADIRAIPLCNESVAGVVSPGAIEHSVEGPASDLAEYFRVLRPGGIAVITEPNFSAFRRWVSVPRAPERWLRASPTLRRFVGRLVGRQSLSAAKARTPRPWHAEFTHTEEGGASTSTG